MEEIILECGKYFRHLTLHTDHNKWKDKPKWQVKSNKNYCDINTIGNTPLEAITLFRDRLKQSKLI